MDPALIEEMLKRDDDCKMYSCEEQGSESYKPEVNNPVIIF